MAKNRTIALALVSTLAAPALAQVERPPIPPIGGQQRAEQRRLFDRVIGVFGDKAILESSIRSELIAQVKGFESENRRLTADEIAHMRRSILSQKLREEALAQGARTMPGNSREKVDQIVNHYLDDNTRQEVERAGSLNQLTQELGVLGKTLESVNEARRTELLGVIARQENLRRKWRDRFALAVTPNEIRAYYLEHIEQFAEPASADLEVIAVPAAGGKEASLAAAKKAAEMWRETHKTVSEVAEQVGGVALDLRRKVTSAKADPRPAEIKAFATSAGDGEVSEPILRGNAYWVLRVASRRSGRKDAFEDPDVQAWILNKLVTARINAESENLILKNSQKFRKISTRGGRR